MCRLATATDLDHPEAVAARTVARQRENTDVDLLGATVLAVKIIPEVTAIAALVATEAASTTMTDAMVAHPLAEEAHRWRSTLPQEGLEAGTMTLTDATTVLLQTRTSTVVDAPTKADHRGTSLLGRAGTDLVMVAILVITTAEVEAEVATGKPFPTLPSLGAIPYFI
jgi:hypothetical protein